MKYYTDKDSYMGRVYPPCQYHPDAAHIGSSMCHSCKHFISDDIDKNNVVCQKELDEIKLKHDKIKNILS